MSLLMGKPKLRDNDAAAEFSHKTGAPKLTGAQDFEFQTM